MIQRKMIVIVVMSLLLLRCNNASRVACNPMYFASPVSAVEQITIMLKAKDWAELANYYDLTNSPVDRSKLISGEFFYTNEKPPNAHPAGFWHFKHPFSPDFKYHSYRDLEESNIIEVVVQVEIDQGGGMVQRGLQAFLMRKSIKGFQILPQKGRAP
jgi:hypothetical protein